MAKPESDHDIANTTAWAEIVGDLLLHVPPDKRAEVLALASQNEEADRREREANGGVKFIQISEDWMNGQRRNNAITRLKSLVIQVFVRDITNNHSPQDAASILFAEHPYGTGSRRLRDYLPGRK